MPAPDEDSRKHLLPLDSARQLVAEMRGIPLKEVHLRGLIGEGYDADEARGYAELLSDAALHVSEKGKCKSRLIFVDAEVQL